MNDSISQSIGESLYNFQSALGQSGESLESFIRSFYVGKWTGDDLYHALAIRTTFVNAMHNHLTELGLFNLERVSLSPVTDPLAHDVEHTPSIRYKGHHYMTTHSMIYSKFLACFNPKLKGIFVDSPNIRLELESAAGIQRSKYLIDFSQMDVEVRRNRGIDLDTYLNEPDKVKKILAEDYEKALSLFENLVIAAMTKVAERNDENLKALGVAVEVPKSPFPRYYRDEAVRELGTKALEKPLGRKSKHQFFWILGLMRENYDLIYPYLKPDGTRTPIRDFSSPMIYNYDLCAQSIVRKTGERGTAYEVLSGAVREWLYEPIVARLLDNKIISVKPEISDGNIVNINELGGYGPFLMAVYLKNAQGTPYFPDTFGGGLGIERALFALTAGDRIGKVDEVTCFGKNPDSHPIYLF